MTCHRGGFQAAVFATSVLLVAACGHASSESGRQADSPDYWRRHVLSSYEMDPGFSMPFPVVLPGGYTFGGFSAGSYEHAGAGGDRRATSRTADFLADDNVVALCAEVVAADGSFCPRSNVGLERLEAGVRLTVYLEEVNPGDIKRWRDVTYSSDVAEVSWLNPAR